MVSERVWSQTVTIENDIGYLRLYHPDGRIVTHMFSPMRAHLVASKNWCPGGASQKYARTMTAKGNLTLQQLLLGLSPGDGLTGDHINRNPYDSRDENLRIATKREQMHNRSDQSEHGPGVNNEKPGRVQVNVWMGKRFIYQPSFKLEHLEAAKLCRDEFLTIARQIDAGLRDVPTKDELRTIANRFRQIS